MPCLICFFFCLTSQVMLQYLFWDITPERHYHDCRGLPNQMKICNMTSLTPSVDRDLYYIEHELRVSLLSNKKCMIRRVVSRQARWCLNFKVSGTPAHGRGLCLFTTYLAYIWVLLALTAPISKAIWSSLRASVFLIICDRYGQLCKRDFPNPCSAPGLVFNESPLYESKQL